MNRPKNKRYRRSKPTRDYSEEEMNRVLQRIKLNQELLDFDIFYTTAKDAAKIIGRNKCYSKNKPTQVRRFYNELLDLEKSIFESEDADALRKNLPLLRMLNAKAEYAEGRNLVDENFTRMLRHCIGQIDPSNPQPQTLKNCCLFFEAFMGFYKVVRPSG